MENRMPPSGALGVSDKREEWDDLPLTLDDRRTLLASRFGRGLRPRDLAVLLGRETPTGAAGVPEAFARLQTHTQADLLARTAQPQRVFFVVLSGRLEVVRHRASGGRRVLDTVGAGGACGAVTAFGPNPRWPADVEALTDTRVLAVSAAVLLADAEPDETRQRILQNCAGILAERARHLNARAELFNRRGLRERLAFWLLRAADERGHVRGAMTRQALADHLGVSRASMTRELGRMADEGLIALRGRAFEIVQRDILDDLAQ